MSASMVHEAARRLEAELGLEHAAQFAADKVTAGAAPVAVWVPLSDLLERRACVVRGTPPPRLVTS